MHTNTKNSLCSVLLSVDIIGNTFFLKTIRVYNDIANKCTFQRTSVQDFPQLEELEEFKTYVSNISSNILDTEEVDQLEFSYVGASKTKFYVIDSTLKFWMPLKAASSTGEMSLCFL